MCKKKLILEYMNRTKSEKWNDVLIWSNKLRFLVSAEVSCSTLYDHGTPKLQLHINSADSFSIGVFLF